ncbi:lipid II:glycine glycyltransferase FemX [Nocardioides donggukensis]|uniref:lipid II:glycine glycyltransferase FemX n=1 Tax=Nocardioides donggukensis TaxID=2774019 RepID=UPI00298C877E|nr:peptidoglycan bridge formation glycyltransferase FemA/FemB family protein [Nocardioides donggukensis]
MPPSSPVPPHARLTVRTISAAQHLDHVRSLESASFLQTPAWGEVKREWRRESIGFFADQELVGSALVLYRALPRVRRYLAYLPEGPLVDWADEDLGRWLTPMVDHLRSEGAFGVRMGPPVVTRRWTAAQVKEGIASDEVRRLGEVAPEERTVVGARVTGRLRELGWRPQAVEGGFAAGQPQYNFAIPLRDADGTQRTEDDVLRGMNQQWRRNIKKAAKAGVEVTSAAGPDIDEAGLSAFHDLYLHTAERDGFTPRPRSYFATMVSALAAEEPDRIRLYAARHEGELVGATIGIRVGSHVWYSYGASSSEKRDVRGSNAVQWAMIQDAIAAGAALYDLRGITDTLDSDDSHVGLIQFKVGTGGEAMEYAGEWDLPVNRAIYAAFALYLRRRG